MIVTKQKAFEDILKKIEGSVFIFGCGICSDTSRTGGPKEVEEMKRLLNGANVNVNGTYVIDAMCHLQKVKKAVRDNKAMVELTDTILVLSCGSGVQSAVASLNNSKKIISGVDTLFLGNIESLSSLKEMCSLCGQCVLNETSGVCPVTLCPKGLLNGPCGGMKNSKCEVEGDLDCVWVKIYERSLIQNSLNDIKKISPPKDYSVKKHAGQVKFTGSH